MKNFYVDFTEIKKQSRLPWLLILGMPNIFRHNFWFHFPLKTKLNDIYTIHTIEDISFSLKKKTSSRTQTKNPEERPAKKKNHMNLI